MRILGIDPGTTTIGYAVCERIERDFHILDFGVIKTTPKQELNHKLYEIGIDMKGIIQRYNPEICAVEKLFFNTNITTGIAVSHARGVILYECMKAGIDIKEYTPLQVKKGLTGNGQAKKGQVQKALMMLLGLSSIPKPDDAADALALAYIGSLGK
ncbi:crossover junction endodeoxyribonuclease RuvC [Candidatus Gracilibacteria bacterium]|nr:crossover junction endodeoxyribonuclease RuvC [Candidatus Gracilibacteria bacterium]